MLLVRVENTSREEMDEFMPAEFRWHVPRINDNLWHHYTVTMDTVNDVGAGVAVSVDRELPVRV